MTKNILFSLGLVAFLSACTDEKTAENQVANNEASEIDSLRFAQESHLKNIRQLTFGGDNAEAYFSFNNQYLIFQATNPKWDAACDQIFYIPIDGKFQGKRPPLLSTGKGRTTCPYFLPGDTTILYASTHLAGESCMDAPRVVDGKYVWSIFKQFDIFVADLQGNILRQLTDSPGYDAEATISPDGEKIVFTSTRSGDLELWTMNLDGSDLRQVTDELGYDGGAFFSPDSKKLVFRASRPKTKEAVTTYKELFAQGLVQPTHLEIFVCNVDGSNLQQITNLGGASWAPFFHPSGKRIIFSTNYHTESKRQFNLFSVKVDGTGLEQITFDKTFDSFAMFSSDGKYLAFSSNRHNGGTRDTNVFLAEWVE